MNRYRLLLLMSACFACVALDNSKLIAALPTLTRVGSISPELQRWTVEASLLVYASLLLLGGSLSERFGARRVLIFGLCGFGGASLLGAFTGFGFWLIVARACSGAATACVTPATLATLKHSFDERERPTAIAVWTASFSVGAALGPVLAGLLVDHGGLPAVLLANVPPIVLCAWASLRLVPADLPRRDQPLDFRGAGLCLGAAVGALFAILSGPSHGWLSPQVLSSSGFAFVCLLLARSWLERAPHPLLELSLFSAARFRQALLVIFISYFAFSGVSFVLAQYLQLARTKGALNSGLMSLPLTAAMLLGTLLAPRLIRHWRAERALSISLVSAVIGASLLAVASHGQNDLLLCAALVPFGAGSGSAFATATELVLGSVSEQRAAIAAATSESAFEFGGVLGIAVLSTLLGGASLPPALLAEFVPRAFATAAVAVLFAWSVAERLSRSTAARTTPNECSDP
ncbi:MAG TPA: MFS transporter [Polyangiaceae bacterium]|nr:MFS transporter [Polyangiaceae bacterium]